MLHPPGFQTRPWRRLSWRRCSALLYGRALDLPPSPLSIDPRAGPYPIAAALQPFRRRVYRQRALVTVVRLLVLAALVAAATLLLRIMGLALPLPAAPLVAAAIVLLAGLGTLPWHAPSTPQLAHDLDRRLGLHEQLASALEFERDDRTGRGDGINGISGVETPAMTDLRGRALATAATTLRNYHPAGLLPWPSLRRELYALAGLSLLAAIMALAAPRIPTIHTNVTAVGAVAGHGAKTPPHAPRVRVMSAPIKILSIGSPPGTTGAHPGAAHNGHSMAVSMTQGKQSNGQGGARLVPGKGSTLGAGRGTGQGTSGAAPGNGRQGQGTRTQPSNSGAKLNLSAGKNSTAGGVESPQQRALKNLQNSIQSAQAQTSHNGQNGQGQNGQNGQNQNGQNGQNGQQGSLGQLSNGQNSSATTNRAGANGKQGQGAGKSGKGNTSTKSGANGRRAGGSGRTGGGRGANGRQGQGNGLSTDPTTGGGSFNRAGAGQGSSDGPNGRFGHPGAGQGVDSGASTPQGTAKGAHAALSNGGDVTLNGAPDKGGQLIFSVGQPSRSTGTGASAPSGGASGATVTVPGYVAPDSNAITPDDRSVVQGYFTPSSQS
jgi:hypothetical protein